MYHTRHNPIVVVFFILNALCAGYQRKSKKKYCFGIFTCYFSYSSGMSLTPSVQRHARGCLWSAVSKSPDAVGWQMGVHHRGTSCCNLPPVCSCVFFLSFSSRFPSHLLMWLICVRTLQAQNWIALTSNVIPGLLTNSCSCSFQSIAGVCGKTWFERNLVLSLCAMLVLCGEEGFSLPGCWSDVLYRQLIHPSIFCAA